MSAVKERARMDRSQDKILSVRTQSGLVPKKFYGPEDIADIDYERDLGDPGSFPFTRGRFPGMYRDLLWQTWNSYGFETPEQTGERAEALVKMGLTSISSLTDVHMEIGADPDHPAVRDTVGFCCTPCYSVDCLERELEGVELVGADISLASGWMTAEISKYAMLLIIADKRGVDRPVLRGGCLNDAFSMHANGISVWNPLEMDFRLSIDLASFAATQTPKWNIMVPCGYDYRNCGCDSVQELAFLMAARIAYCDALLERGLSFERFAPKIPLLFSSDIDFFETCCRFRAARRMWAKIARDRYHATDPKAMRFPLNARTATQALQRPQPVLNIARNAIQALASVMGGAQGLSITPFDEPLAIPSEASQEVSVGIGQIIAQETGVPLVADPLGGSYYVEWLTKKLEDDAGALMQKIDDMGGYYKAVESGWVLRQLKEAQLLRTRELMNGEVVKVGVNAFQHLAAHEIPVKHFEYSRSTGSREQILDELDAFRKNRDQGKARNTLHVLRSKTATKENLTPYVIDAYKANATYGEVTGMMREGYGLTYDAHNMVPRPSFLD